MTEQPNILLMGVRGSGKTTVGRLLAERLGRPFVDLDEAVVDLFDERTVGEIWESHGEPGWRKAEAAALVATLETVGQVVALGGGTPTIQSCATLIDEQRSEGRVWAVYLVCPVDVLAGRLDREQGDRPSLTGDGVVEEIGAVVTARDGTYRRLADFVCEAGGSVEETLEALLQASVGPEGRTERSN